MATYNTKLALEYAAPHFLMYYIPLGFFTIIMSGGALQLFQIPKLVVFLNQMWNTRLQQELRVYRAISRAFPDISVLTAEEKAQQLRLQRRIIETQYAIVDREHMLNKIGVLIQTVIIILLKLIIFGVLSYFVAKNLYNIIDFYDYVGNDLITDNKLLSRVLRFPIERHQELAGLSVLVYFLCWLVIYCIIEAICFFYSRYRKA
ncbi:uncharacterized protein LOC119670175 [Teleopsis dalmanni]|uniref:uncharacterized protein LOC119670175 n=1 Tax=Teleopsis dalmanni TaxID=139649 RepID=UPI0018CE1D3C|nr:uncharacterized protein LOC119670175 [Teleopsis dalmanni]XP_037936266.1 uncharacterized protein LOC119670175 [Teleopsis dalmanni]XP_037936267.1 uncharacterized protein LOC119670175 [Teleopsis dalmanni]